MKEIWQNIPDFEGEYQSSNLGRIKSTKFGKEKILKSGRNNWGYLSVSLCKNGKQKNYLVHRLVWMAFHGVIPEGMQINHINEVVWDNRLENLELVTCKENNNWGTANERRRNTLTNYAKFSKPVLQYDLNGNLIKEWCSVSEIERQLGYPEGDISRCCRERRKSAYKFKWRYIN